MTVLDGLRLPNEGWWPFKPKYVYVASSWRNPMQPVVCAALKAAKIDHYDFRNPATGSVGFSWKEVKTSETPSATFCAHCGDEIVFSTYRKVGRWEPDYDPDNDPEIWRHKVNGYAGCGIGAGTFATLAVKEKNTDWETVPDYLQMIEHPRALEGYAADYYAMESADTFVLILPCGKSAHLELGWAVGMGKNTAILLEDPVEPELMYRMVDYISPNLVDLLGWLGVEN